MSIHEKLFEAQVRVSGVAKSGRNQAQQYDFVRAVDVVKEGKRALQDVGLSVRLSVQNERFDNLRVIERNGKAPIILYTVRGKLIVTDPDDGSEIEVGVVGAGSSYGDEKGIYKAVTGAWKYGIRALLQIPDEADDPEIETENDREVAAPAKPAKPAQALLATPAQKKMLLDRATEAGLDTAAFKALAFETVGKADSKELVQRDVEAILAKLNDPEAVAFYTGTKVVED